jgi:hypothetical protein
VCFDLRAVLPSSPALVCSLVCFLRGGWLLLAPPAFCRWLPAGRLLFHQRARAGAHAKEGREGGHTAVSPVWSAGGVRATASSAWGWPAGTGTGTAPRGADCRAAGLCSATHARPTTQPREEQGDRSTGADTGSTGRTHTCRQTLECTVHHAQWCPWRSGVGPASVCRFQKPTGAL